MSEVTEKAIYRLQGAKIIPIEKNTEVNIIEEKYTKFNPTNFKTYSTDDTMFLKGIFIEVKEITPLETFARTGGVYTVKLDDGSIITFNQTEYYFKVEDAPTMGGRKKSRRSKKFRQNYKKIKKSCKNRC
jgi:hypothetical protein